MLYKAGVLNGASPQGYFSPYRPITRAEAALLLCRVIRPENRVSLPAEFLPDPRVTVTRLPFASREFRDNIRFSNRLIYQEEYRSGEWQRVVTIYNEEVIPQIDAYIDYESEGIFTVYRRDVGDDANCIYYTRDGKRLNDITYWSGTDFDNGYAAVQDERFGPIRLIDLSGRVVRTLSNGGYRIGGDISGGYLRVFTPEENFISLMDIETGCVTDFPQYLEVSAFVRGISVVRNRQDFTFNLMGTDLKEILPQDQPIIDSHMNGFVSAVGVINMKGEIVISDQYGYTDTLFEKGYALFDDDINHTATVRRFSTGELRSIMTTTKNFGFLMQNDFLILSLEKRFSGGPIWEQRLADLDGNQLSPVLELSEIWLDRQINKSDALYYYDEGYYFIEIK
jgi:hypothetical protein